MIQQFNVPDKIKLGMEMCFLFSYMCLRLSCTQFRWTEKDDPKHHLMDGRQKPLFGNCVHHCWVHMFLLRSCIADHPSQIWK